MLTINQTAPAIDTVSISGDRVDLTGICSHSRVLVKFHRFSGCPIAQRQIDELATHQQRLTEAGIETIVVLHNAAEKVTGVLSETPGLQIIADRDKALYRAYGAEFKLSRMWAPRSWIEIFKSLGRGYFPRPGRFQGGIVGVPADFLIDQGGKITRLHYGRHYGDSWSADQILAAET